jgi:hypothetical protein
MLHLVAKARPQLAVNEGLDDRRARLAICLAKEAAQHRRSSTYPRVRGVGLEWWWSKAVWEVGEQGVGERGHG